MRFVLTGKVAGKRTSIVWHDGRLEGDSFANSILESLAKAKEGTVVSLAPGAPATTTDHLSDPFSTISLFGEIADDLDISGDAPVLEEPPEGAVA